MPDAARTAEIAEALKLIARERLQSEREQIAAGVLRGDAAYKAGQLTGTLYVARDRVLLLDDLVAALRGLMECIPEDTEFAEQRFDDARVALAKAERL